MKVRENEIERERKNRRRIYVLVQSKFEFEFYERVLFFFAFQWWCVCVVEFSKMKTIKYTILWCFKHLKEKFGVWFQEFDLFFFLFSKKCSFPIVFFFFNSNFSVENFLFMHPKRSTRSIEICKMLTKRKWNSYSLAFVWFFFLTIYMRFDETLWFEANTDRLAAFDWKWSQHNRCSKNSNWYHFSFN